MAETYTYTYKTMDDLPAKTGEPFLSWLTETIKDDDKINIKEFSFDDKVLFFKEVLKCEQLGNVQILLNLLLLVRPGNVLEDDVFENEDLYIKNIEEYLDVKFEIKDEVKVFTEKLMEYFIGMLKGISRDYGDLQPVPIMYQRMLLAMDMASVSILLNKISFAEGFENIKPVCGGKFLWQDLADRTSIYNKLLTDYNSDKTEEEKIG